MTMLRDSDLDILRYVHELRFCTVDHLTALTGRHRQSLNLRLQSLIAEKYIHRYRFPNPNHKHIYSLGSQGFQHLAYNGTIKLDHVPARLRTSELKPLFIDHTLLVTDIHVSLILGSDEDKYRLVEWREGRELYESVTFYENGKKKRLPVCPDAFFEIERNGNRFAYALEADRGTTTRRTFDDKIRAYWRFLEQNRQIKSYGVKWFRVLTVTLSDARAKNLEEYSSGSISKKYSKSFYFASFKDFEKVLI